MDSSGAKLAGKNSHAFYEWIRTFKTRNWNVLYDSRQESLCDARTTTETQHIVFVEKCARWEINTKFAQEIQRRRIEVRARTRNPNIFHTEGLPMGSAIANLITLTNAYRMIILIIDLTLTTQTKRSNLKAFILDARVVQGMIHAEFYFNFIVKPNQMINSNKHHVPEKRWRLQG